MDEAMAQGPDRELMKPIAVLEYIIQPKEMTKQDRLAWATMLSAYAADLQKGAVHGGKKVRFAISGIMAGRKPHV